MIYEISKFLCFIVLKIFFKLEVKGKEFLPCNRPFIIASNHISYLDPVVVGAGCSCALHYLAKEELFKNKLFSLLLSNLNVIPLKRSTTDFRALRMALAILGKKPLAIFPQGARIDSYDTFKAGVGFLYNKTSTNIFAAKVYGTDKILPKGVKSFKKGKIKVIFDEVTGINESDSYQEITSKVIAKIRSL